MKTFFRALTLSIAFVALCSCQKEVILPPSLSVASAEMIAAEGQDVELKVELVNATSEGISQTTCVASEDWISDLLFSAEKLMFAVAPYEASREAQVSRTASITIAYPGIEKVIVSIVQKAPETLPGQSFELSSVISGVKVFGSCQPLYDEDTYVFDLVKKADFDAAGEKFVENYIKGHPDFASSLKKGAVHNQEFELAFETEYYFVAFGLDADGNATTAVTKIPVSSLNRPVISANDATVMPLPAKGAEYKVNVTVENAVEGIELSVASSQKWLEATLKDGVLTYVVSDNDAEFDSPAREAEITLSYKGAEDVVLSVSQASLKKPVLSTTKEKEIGVPAEGLAQKTLSFSVENPIEGQVVTATSSVDWITLEPLSMEDGIVVAVVKEQPADAPARTGKVTLSYKGADDLVFTFNQVTSKKPEVTVTWDETQELSAEGGTFTIPYTIKNPVEGAILTVTSYWKVVKDIKVGNKEITFTLDANPETEVRKDELMVDYMSGDVTLTGVRTKVLQAAQKAPEPQELTFTLTVKSVSADKVIVDCTPSNMAATYVLDVVEKSDFDKRKDDMAYIQSKLDAWRDPWMYDSISNHLTSGVKTDHSISLSRENMDYYLIAWGLNEDGTVTSKVISTKEFRSLGRPSISFAGGWDPWATLPKKGGHYDVTVNISNPTATDVLTAENKSPEAISNVQIVKVSNTEYTVSFDLSQNDKESTRWLTLRLFYGSVKKNLLDGNAQSGN